MYIETLVNNGNLFIFHPNSTYQLAKNLFEVIELIALGFEVLG